MAFFQDDYFKRTPATLEQVRGGGGAPPSPIDAAAALLARAKTGNTPTAEEVQVALRNLMSATPPGSKKSPQETSLINALMYDMPKYASKPQLYNDPADAFKTISQPAKPNNFASVLGKPMSQGISKGVGDIAGAITGLAGDLFGGPQQESPEDMLRRLMGEAGSYQYNGPSAHQMAQQEFDPQFQILKDIANQTTSRYNTNKAEISNMYNDLVNLTIQGRGEAQTGYNQAVQGSQSNYAAASKNLSDAATANQSAMAQELARLGIKEGTGDVVAGLQQNLQDNVGRLSAQGQGTQDLLKSLGANQYAYDTNAINLNKQQGIQTQQDFLSDYMNALSQNDQQRLALTGQRQQAENNYGLQIQKMLQEGNSSIQSNVMDMFSALQGANNNQAQQLSRQAQLDLDQAKFAFEQQQAAAKTGNTTLNAYDALAQRAAQVYKGDPIKTRQAVDEILAAYQNNPNAKTVGDFLNSVDQDTLRRDPALTSLIYDFMNRVLQSQPR